MVGEGEVVSGVWHASADCASADGKLVVGVELKSGKYSRSGLGCPTLDCCHCRRDHYYDSLQYCGIGHVALTSYHLAPHQRPEEQGRSIQLHFVLSYPYNGPSVDYMRGWLDGLRQKEATAVGYGIFLDLEEFGWTQSRQ